MSFVSSSVSLRTMPTHLEFFRPLWRIGVNPVHESDRSQCPSIFQKSFMRRSSNTSKFVLVARVTSMYRSGFGNDSLSLGTYSSGVKNTVCLPIFTSFPPRINPERMMECMSWKLPTWYKYSAKSLGNNTLSCNVGSLCFPPEWP